MKFLHKINWTALDRFSNRLWFLPLIGTLAGLDLFILIVPTDGISVSATMLQPKRWIRIASSIAIGSTIGAFFLTWLVKHHGPWMIQTFFESTLQSSTWIQAQNFIAEWGHLAICAVAMSFLPLQPVVVLAGLSTMPLSQIVVWLFLGRVTKFIALGWVSSHAPRLLGRFSSIRKELNELNNTGAP
jgi:membrane protein YqaA with SNARE-associated domain